jgi:alkylated DNA nucleotide flippase Atl1
VGPADKRRNYVRSTGTCALPPGNTFLSSQATGTTPWHHVVRRRGRKQGYLHTTVRSRQPVLLGEFHAQMTQRPVHTKSSVAWELRLAVKDGST